MFKKCMIPLVLALTACVGGQKSEPVTLADRAEAIRERVFARQAREYRERRELDGRNFKRTDLVLVEDDYLSVVPIEAARVGSDVVVRQRGKPIVRSTKGAGQTKALIRQTLEELGITSGGVYTPAVSDALILGAATTSGIRLDLESGVLAVREGDDSAYANVLVGTVYAGSTSTGANLQSDRLFLGGSSYGSRLQTRAGPDALRVVHNTSGNSETWIAGSTTTSSALTSGASYTFTGALPDGAIVLGVAVRITTTITGPTSVQVGDGSDADRYGEFSTLTSGQTLTPANATATPLGWQATAGDVVLTAVGGNFTAGVVKIVVHYIAVTAPGV